jgi:hypothetical protein
MKKMNIERPTSNDEWLKMKRQETEGTRWKPLGRELEAERAEGGRERIIALKGKEFGLLRGQGGDEATSSSAAV